MARRKIGIALGGGGARGFAHLGVLIALEENHIPIDGVAGTSMGAAVGAVKALGADLNKLTRVLSCLDLNELLQVSDSTMREMQRVIGRGMVEYVRGTNWREGASAAEALSRMVHLFSLLTASKTFAELVIPFAAVAADVETGERVVLTEGKLYQAVAASAAIPGIFSPVSWNNRYLIDGGVVDKIPVAATIDLGVQTVIAVDASAPLAHSVNTSLDILLQSQRITSQRLTLLQIEQARKHLNGRFLLLRPDVRSITMLAFDRLSDAVQAGKEEALAHMDKIRKLCRVRAHC